MFAPKIPVKPFHATKLVNYLAYQKRSWDKFNKVTGKSTKEPYPTCEDEYLTQKSLEHAFKN